ncbi:MAG: addiction module antidote protein, HigA family [Parvularcula sp.]|nr:addiction module antidote protein, HigA family [Parvularcula sp.]
MAIKIGMRPSHPGSYVKNWVLPEGMTVTQAAKHLGVTRQALDALLNERSTLSSEMALRIEKAFGQPMEALMRMQLIYDAHAVRQQEAEIARKVEPYCAA